MNRKKNPYQIIKHRHVTEKAIVLEGLKTAESNPSLKRCVSPKYVFVVDRSAKKPEIASALEEIYKEEKIKVLKVNTVSLPGKVKRVRGRIGSTSPSKKAIVTLRPGDSLDNL